MGKEIFFYLNEKKKKKKIGEGSLNCVFLHKQCLLSQRAKAQSTYGTG